MVPSATDSPKVLERMAVTREKDEEKYQTTRRGVRTAKYKIIGYHCFLLFSKTNKRKGISNNIFSFLSVCVN